MVLLDKDTSSISVISYTEFLDQHLPSAYDVITIQKNYIITWVTVILYWHQLQKVTIHQFATTALVITNKRHIHP